jgi:hypothetical protein
MELDKRINPILIGGAEVFREEYPKFYNWAYSNPEQAQRQVEAILKAEQKAGNTKFSPISAVRLIDSDLH